MQIAPLYFVISLPPGITPPFISPAKSPYKNVKAYKRRLRRQFQTKKGTGEGSRGGRTKSGTALYQYSARKPTGSRSLYQFVIYP